MTNQELATAVQYDLPVKILVMNNDGYGIVRMWNHRFYEGRETGVIKRHKNWALLARGNGFATEMAEQLRTPTELAPALQRAIAHRRPHLLELITPYEECLPLMPPGKSFNDMIVDA